MYELLQCFLRRLKYICTVYEFVAVVAIMKVIYAAKKVKIMTRVVSGASGFIGSALINSWLEQGTEEAIYAFTHSPEKITALFKGRVHPVKNLDDIPLDEHVDVVVNLAGAPILDKRWNDARKKILYDSRIEITKQLVSFVQSRREPVSVFVSGSAIGFYGNHIGDKKLNEEGHSLPCFAHKLCADWENLTSPLESEHTRVCLLRTGIVLGKGGALSKMLPPFRLGLGGPVASGQQWMSWIDLTDMVAGINYLIAHETLHGPFNLTAPEPVRNEDFTKALAAQLKRPAFFPMPAFVLDLLLGEGAELLVEGQRVVPERLLQAGFQFKYETLEASLANAMT